MNNAERRIGQAAGGSSNSAFSPGEHLLSIINALLQWLGHLIRICIKARLWVILFPADRLREHTQNAPIYVRMASSLPIPAPPRTPTPPPDEQQSYQPADQLFNPNALSPMAPISAIEHTRESSMNPSSPMSPTFPSASSDGQANVKTDDPNPFNFQPTVLAKSPVVKSVGYYSLVPGKLLLTNTAEHWSATWSQV